MRRRARAGQEKKGNSRPILKRLRAALLRSFRGQHSEKLVCMRRVLGVTGTLSKANNHFDPTQSGFGDRTTTLKRLLISAVMLLALKVEIPP